ncbi:MAG: AMP-binding protein, partial [Clostridia bacterium]|nr:AMP-binding protein [Clostridia bacterium]
MLIDRFCRTDFSSYEDFKKNFKITVPERFNFAHDVMDVLAEEKPDKGCLLWCDDHGREREITFGEMRSLSNSCANMMAAHGIRKGDFVVATLRSRYEFWIVAIACHKLGAVLVPVTHMSTEKDFAYRFVRADVKAVFAVCDERLLSCIRKAEEETGHALTARFVIDGEREDFLNFDREMAKYGDDWERIPNENSDPMLCYFTSGTSGYPKMALHNYAYPLGHILTAKFWQTLREDDLHFTSADTGWAKTSWGKLYGQWICEAENFIYDYGTRFIPTDLLKIIEKYKITVFCAPPTIFRFLIKENVEDYDLSSLRYCTIAGEPLNAEVFNRWKELTGLELREGFGQTETPVLIANWPWIKPKPGSTGKFAPHFDVDLINGDGARCEVGEEGEICISLRDGIPAGLVQCYYKDEEKTGLELHEGFGQTETPVLFANFPYFEVRPGSMGKPTPYFDIQLLDENEQPCEDGVEGVISICGIGDHGPSGLFRGYYRNDEANAESWYGGVYHTGDLAYRDADGYYWFKGRNDDVIKCSGYRIGPVEVENVLMQHPSVLECAITAYPDPGNRGEV